MKKRLLVANVILYMILYGISLFNVGFYYGRRWDNYYRPGPDGFVLPVLHLIMLLWGVYLLCKQQYVTPKSYCILGVFTLLHIWLLVGISFVIAFLHKGWLHAITPSGEWYMIMVYVFSAVICIVYIICAVLTYREYKEIRRQRRESASQ